MGHGRVVVAAAAVAAGLCLPALAAAPASAATGSAAGSAAGSGTVDYGAQTAAQAVHVVVTQQPAASIITADLVDDVLGYATGELDTGSNDSQSEAASIFPGNLVVQGPSLLCNEGVLPFSCPVTPPSYPLLAHAAYPSTPTSTAGASSPQNGSGFAASASSATATASATGGTSHTSGSSGALLAGTPVATSIGSVTAGSTVTQTASGLSVVVTATASDVSIGGLVRIGSVSASDTVTLAPGAKPADSPRIAVSDVTVAGTPASIDDKGIHVAGQKGPSLGRDVAQRGITIRTVGTDVHDTATGAQSDATGLEISLSVPVSGVPYVPNPLGSVPPFDNVPGVDANGTYLATVTLASVGSADALTTETAGSFPIPTLPSGTVPTATGSAGSPGTPGIPGTPGLPGTTQSVPGSSSPVVAAAPGRPDLVLVGLSRDDLERLYLVLAIGSMALLLGWRATMLRQTLRRR